MLVDEMLVYAGAPHGVWGMTAKVRYWLRRPIPRRGADAARPLVQRSERGFRAVVRSTSPTTASPPRARACASSASCPLAPASLV